MYVPNDILSNLGKVTYTGAEINAWMAYHYRMGTPYKRIVIDFLRAYGNYGISSVDHKYIVCRTSDYPKSARENGNNDGEYMLRRVSTKNRGRRNIKKRQAESTGKYKLRFTQIRNDQIFYV